MKTRPDLYGVQNASQDPNRESDEEIEISGPVIKEEYGYEYVKEVEEDLEDYQDEEEEEIEVKRDPESDGGYEEEEAETETEDESEEQRAVTPPRTVILRGAKRKEEDKKAKRARIAEDQRTKPAKARIGTRHAVFNRLSTSSTPPRSPNRDLRDDISRPPRQATQISP